MYNSAQNYGIRQINAGNTTFLAELFNNYKTLLQTGLIYDGAFLTQADYRNTITAGLRMKEYAWVEAFIHGQKQHLDPRHRNNTFSYNLANFYYQTGAPARAKRLLQSVEFTDVFYGLNARAILVQVYYEDEDDDALLDLEDIARRRGMAVGMGFAYPITLDRISLWARTLEQKGFVLAPVSATVREPG